LANLFNLTPEEAARLVGGSPPEILAAENDGASALSGTIDIGEAGDEVAARLADVLALFDEADEALPDFAEFERRQSEAIEQLQSLLAEIAVEEPELETVETEEDTNDSA